MTIFVKTALDALLACQVQTHHHAGFCLTVSHLRKQYFTLVHVEVRRNGTNLWMFKALRTITANSIISEYILSCTVHIAYAIWHADIQPIVGNPLWGGWKRCSEILQHRYMHLSAKCFQQVHPEKCAVSIFKFMDILWCFIAIGF